jgi:hypothetical protein
MAWSRKPKTLNNGSKPLAQNFFYVPQSLKNTPTKEGQNKPENAKTD